MLLRLLLGGGRGNAVLLVGPCDAGKTMLWHQLTGGSTHQGTVASMTPNEAEGPLAGEAPGARPVLLVDVPGHPRVRGAAERYAERAAGVVFLVDSVDFMPRKAEAAECAPGPAVAVALLLLWPCICWAALRQPGCRRAAPVCVLGLPAAAPGLCRPPNRRLPPAPAPRRQLYELLSMPAVAKRRPPVLLAANKQDQGSRAHTLDFIRKRLEKELDSVRAGEGAHRWWRCWLLSLAARGCSLLPAATCRSLLPSQPSHFRGPRPPALRSCAARAARSAT